MSSPPAVSTETPQVDTGPVQVLILDDNPGDRFLLVTRLEEAGLDCEVTEAATLDEFAAAIEARAFQIAFLDHALAPGDGFDALVQLVHHPRQKAVAPIMITAAGEIQVAVEAMRHGCVDYLTKDDLSVDILRKSIAQSIEKKILLSALSHEGELRVAARASLRRISRACARDLRALLSTLLRQLRTMRTLQRQQMQDAANAIAEIEATTDRMWTFLDTLPGYFEAPVDLQKLLPREGAANEAGENPDSVAA